MSQTDPRSHGASGRTRHAFVIPSEARDKPPRFIVREARLPIGDDYVIEHQSGGRLFVVDGKLLRIRESLTIKDPAGAEVFHVQGTLLGVRDVLTISQGGAPVATVRKLTSQGDPEQYVVELPQSERVEVIGSPADRSYSLSYAGYVVATVARDRMLLSSGYRVQVTPEQDDGVVLAVTICLDVMSRRPGA